MRHIFTAEIIIESVNVVEHINTRDYIIDHLVECYSLIDNIYDRPRIAPQDGQRSYIQEGQIVIYAAGDYDLVNGLKKKLRRLARGQPKFIINKSVVKRAQGFEPRRRVFGDCKIKIHNTAVGEERMMNLLSGTLLVDRWEKEE